MEVRIAIAGSVDVGKSSLIGVLTSGALDDGRGSARASVFRHKHERDTGRTSSINSHHIKHANGVTSLIDLAGHEKYFKTTVNGLERSLADYMAIIIGANNGILRMTREHFTIAFSLQIPTFIIITKIDMTPDHILTQTADSIKNLFRSTSKQECTPVWITQDSLPNYASWSNNRCCIPVFQVSSVSGEGLDLLRRFLFGLKWVIEYPLLVSRSPLFIIDKTYSIKGIGLVVSGIVKYGKFARGDILTIGPFRQLKGSSKFTQVIIRSIHDNFKSLIESLDAGHSGCLNIKPISSKITVKQSSIRNGSVIIKEPRYVYEFTADVKILHHSTTITLNYQPMVHCNGMSQVAKISRIQVSSHTVCDSEIYLRTGDIARVSFRFVYRPAFLEIGNTIIFREGNTKGVGKIISLEPNDG